MLAEDAGKVFTKDGDEEDEDHESEEVWGESRFPEDGGGRVGRRRLHLRAKKKKAKLEVLMLDKNVDANNICTHKFWFIGNFASIK